MSAEEKEKSGSGEAERGMDLSSLFQGFLGQGAGPEPETPGLPDMSNLLGGLLGEGSSEPESPEQSGLETAGLVEGLGLPPSIVQSVLALVMGSLLQGGGLAGLLGRAGDSPLDDEAIRETGVPQRLSLETGLDLPKAVLTVKQVLEMLRKVTKPLGALDAGKPSASGSSSRPKKRRRRSDSSKPAAAARPKKKKASSSQAASKPRPKRPKASADDSKPARPKTRPKAVSKPKPKAKPK